MSEVATDDRAVEDGVKAIEFESPEQLAEMMSKDPSLWQQVMNDLGSQDDPENGIKDDATDLGKVEVVEEVVDADKKDIKQPEDKAPDEDATKDLVSLDGNKIKPEWLGTYLSKGRTYSEAIEEMSKGNKQKDKTIEYYKLEKTPAAERERNEAVARAEKLQKELEDMKVAPEKKEVEKPTKDEDIVVPEAPTLPPPPAQLEGDDLYDDDKLKKYKEDYQSYIADLSGFQTKMSEYYDIKSKKSIQDAIKSSSEKYESDLAEIKKFKEEVTSEKQEKNNDSVVQREFEEIESLRSQYPEILGEGRPISRIEADYVEFLSNLASIAGVTGGIYSLDPAKKGALRSEVSNAFSAYMNQGSQVGQKFRDAAEQRGLGLPEDYDTLKKIYTVRKYRNKFAQRGADGKYQLLPYNDAFDIAKLKEDGLDIKSEVNKKRDEVLDEHNKKEAALSKKNGFAKEAPTETEGAKPMIDNLSRNDLNEILMKHPTMRSEADVKILWSLVDSKKIDPRSFDLDPSSRPQAK